MSANRNDRRAVGALLLMILAGAGVLVIPWFVTPPAYLDLVVHNAAFEADLSAQRVTVTDDHTGKAMSVVLRKVQDGFVAHIGRIRSGAGAFTAQLPGYKTGTARVQAAALQKVRVPLALTPTFGRLELSTVNATRADEAVPAVVKGSSVKPAPEPQKVIVLDLPPGRHRLSAEADGFCPSERDFDVREGQVTKAAFPLSHDLTADEIARFVLGWRNEPHDLDSHFHKSDVIGFPSPAHVWWSHKTGLLNDGATFATLDVDMLVPGGYETVTVRSNAVGDYNYFVHLYAGTGAIRDAGAMVQVYTRGCHVRTFEPPPDCTHRIWDVTNLHYASDHVELAERQRCEDGISIGPIVLKTGQ